MYRRLPHYICLLLVVCLQLSCKTITYHADTEVNYLDTDSYYPADDALAELIAPYSKELSAKMDLVIGELPVKLVKARPNSNLGNWFTDILLAEANGMFYKKSDLAIQNYGGLRVPSISKGDLTVGKIYELMPFDNTLVAIDLPGSSLQQLLDHIAERGGWPMSHTVSFTKKGKKAKDVTIHGAPLDPNKEYRLAIPDYIANGGDSAEFLKTFEQEESGVYIRDVIIEHLKAKQKAGEAIIIDNQKRVH